MANWSEGGREMDGSSKFLGITAWEWMIMIVAVVIIVTLGMLAGVKE